jgi:RHS repeat-associated protein
LTTDTEQKFTGQIRDNETGMDYFHARYFTNALGRFNSPDPANAGAKLENPQSWNGYSYVLNNPLALTDPTGMDSISCDLHNMVPGCTPPYPGNDYQGYAAYVNLMMGNNPFADPFEGFRLMSVPTLLGYQEVPNDPTGSSAAFSAGIEDIPVYGPTFVVDDGDSTSSYSWNSPPKSGTQTRQQIQQACINQFYQSTAGRVVGAESVPSLIPSWNPNAGENGKIWLEAVVGKGGGTFGAGIYNDAKEIQTLNGITHVSSTVEELTHGLLGVVGKAASIATFYGTGVDVLVHAGCANSALNATGQANIPMAPTMF